MVCCGLLVGCCNLIPPFSFSLSRLTSHFLFVHHPSSIVPRPASFTSVNQAGTLPCPNTQMRWFRISCLFSSVSVPAFSPSLFLSMTITWVHLARLSPGRLASPFGSKTFPGISACFVCLVKGTITTVWNLLRLMESRCTTTTGLLSLGSDPLER